MRLAGLYACAAVAAALPILFPDNYFVTVVGISAGIRVILAVGLNLLMGYAGQISLGHAAFFGMGAYASAILTTRHAWPALLAMAAGLAVVGASAWLLARPILRLRCAAPTPSCSSTRSTAPTTSSRPSCSRSWPTSRSPSPSSAPCRRGTSPWCS